MRRPRVAKAESRMMNPRRVMSTLPSWGRRWPLPPMFRLVCLLLLLAFAFQGTRALWSTDEGRYTGNALQMIDSGNYLVPAYSPDRLNFTKPPMTYWVIASVIRLFGHNTWAVRAPYALAFVLTALLLCGMGRRLIPDKPWLPGLIYGCSLGPFLAASVVSTDVLLAFFEALAMFGFVAAELPSRGKREAPYLWLMWLGFGLAFLTKGPPGLVPLLAIVPFIAVRDGRRGLGRIFSPGPLTMFLVVGLLWYVVVMLRYPWLFHYFINYEIYGRLFTSINERNAEWYGWIVAYGPALTLGTLPWWPALARGVPAVISAQRWRSWRHKPSTAFFLLLWLLIPLAVFCLSRSRLTLYVLPLFQPLALMLALELHSRIDLTRAGQRTLLVLWVLVLIAFKGGIGLFLHPDRDNRVWAQLLDRATRGAPYSALVFLWNTDSSVTIEERTPWGIRFYIHRPVYGIAWQASGGPDKICARLRDYDAVLFAVYGDISPGAFGATVTRCESSAQARITARGVWRDTRLFLVQGSGSH